MASNLKSVYNSKIVDFLKNSTIPKTSTVFKGTLYEHTVVRELEHKFHKFGFISGDSSNHFHGSPSNKTQPNKLSDLEIIGGSFDHGIDIIGQLNGSLTKLLVQCKCFSKQKVAGKEIRELVGATSMYKTMNTQFESLSVLASPNTITKDGIQVMNKIPIPLIYIQVSMLNAKDLDQSGQILSVYENDCSYKKYGFSKIN